MTHYSGNRTGKQKTGANQEMHKASTSRRRLRCAVEALESRTLLSTAGGGFTSAGITGSYYNNATLTGMPNFTRVDDRVDFNFGANGTPGGSTDPQYAALGTSNWSAKWVGQIVPRYSQTYTFTATSQGAARLFIAPSGQSFGSPQINDFTEHTTQAVDTYSIALTAGQTYNIELDYATTSSPSEIKLHWASTSTPDEAIEPAASIGLNVDGGDGLLANLTNAATRGVWWAVGNTNQVAPTDANQWPTTDAEVFLAEGDITLYSGGTYQIQFQGTATVSQNINATFHVGSTNYGTTLPAGAGYNSATGLTSATMVVGANGYNGFILQFTNTSREGNITTPQHDGITNLYVMQPTTLGGNTDPTPGTLFTNAALTQLSQYSTLRYMGLTDTNGNLASNWSDRTLVSNQQWNGWSVAQGTGVTANTSGGYGTGLPWEVLVALANETGKDPYINIPANASLTYINNLANLFAYGSDGVNPYTSPQAHPVWAPLNSNLKVYIEYSNEIWNYGFSQAGTGGNGWVNQLSQRALYDYETGNQNDPLYPGGGANAYNDGAVIAPLYISNSSQASAFEATYNANGAWPGYGSPQYFNNSDSALPGYTIYQGWVALRLKQISTAFKSVMGETSVTADSGSSRVRPVFEWQYGGAWDGELADMQALFGATNRVGYYLYGGGGGWYGDDANSGFTDSTYANGNFATSPAISGSPGYIQNPSGTSWTFTGSSGIAANGSTLGNPTAPTLGPPNNPTGSGQTAYLLPGASISQSVHFSGGYADITLLATQTLANDWYHGLSISIDGTPIGQSEGAPLFSGSQNSWNWSRTAAFNVSAGNHTVTFTNTWTSGGASVFLDNLGIQTVNGIFAQTAAAGAPTINTVQSDVQICQQYGLLDVGYEGGFNFNQNLDSNSINGYAEMGNRGYSSNTPNVGEQANLDPRTVPLAKGIINQFYADGGTLPIVFEGYGNPNSWGVAAPTYQNTNTPKQQAVDAIEQALPTAGTFNQIDVPNTLFPSSRNQDFNDANGALQAGGWIDWNIVVPVTGTYTFNAGTTTGGNYRLSINDISALGAGVSGGTINPTMTLHPGVYTLKIEDTSGAFTLNNITVSVAGAPAAPTLNSATDGNQSASLSWTAVAGATGYEVGYGTSSGNYTFVNVGNTTSYSVSGLTNNTPYYLAVYAYNSTGWSLPSAEKGVIPLADNQVGTLASWDFGNLQGSENNIAETGGSSKITASVVSRGPGLTTDPYAGGNAGIGSFGYYPSSNVYGATLSAAIAAGQYVQFTLTPVTGRTFSLQTLTFDPFFQFVSGSGAGISYSTDGGNTFSAGIAASGTPSPSQAGSPFSVDLSGQSSLQNTSASVIIRISLFGNGNYGFSGIGRNPGNDLVVTGSFSAAPVVQTVADAGFESPAISAGSYVYNPTGTPWTFTNLAGVQSNGSAWGAAAAPDGTQTAFLQSNSTSVGSISQSVGFVAGTYQLAFQAARRNGYGLEPIQVKVDGVAVGSPITPASTSFASYNTAAFTVTAGNHTISFSTTNADGHDDDSFIDHIVLYQSITNGGFSSPNVAGLNPDGHTGYYYNPTGAGWTFSPSSGIEHDGSAWGAANAPDGDGQAAFLQNTGSISQSLFLSAGTYTVSFKSASRSYGGPTGNPILFSVDGTAVGNTITPTSTSFNSFTTASFSITTAGTHTIRFAGTTNTGDRSSFIDQVTISDPKAIIKSNLKMNLGLSSVFST